MKPVAQTLKSLPRLYITGALVFILVAVGALTAGYLSYTRPENSPAHNKLAIPELIDSKDSDSPIEIEIQNTEHEFYSGIKSQTRGFSQSYLGPTIKLYNNQNTQISFKNNLDEPTTVHGHGLHVSGMVDGGPQNRIEPGEKWEVTLPIQQQASTNWYHPHLMGKTSEHVHSGLAGLYIVEDENSMSLPLPKEYGIDDIPLIIQDRDFEQGKMKPYEISDSEMMPGKREGTLVTNGTVDPYIEAPQGWVRLRLLNASNARYYDFHLKDGGSFFKIATEGGFLEKPVEISSLVMTPGERNEIMVDMSAGNTRELLATMMPVDEGVITGFLKRTKRVVELRVDPSKSGKGQLPEQLNTINKLAREDAAITRTFELSMDMESDHNHGDSNSEHAHGSMFQINGKSMDISRIDEQINKGDIEIWKIKRDEMDHPFHMHGTSFLILSQNGKAPAPEDQGWKDTVNVGYGWTEIILQFDHEATEDFPYMYHCHILEHEDGGMMGQFTVT